MKFVIVAALMGLCALASAQSSRGSDANRITTTPVPILRQVNKVNEDGSYTYGYENADGSYKIETKDTKGQVQGKYGYYDDAGTLREVEYGASRAGFYPTGTDIKAPEVAPPRNDINAPTDGSYDPNLFTYPYSYENERTQQGGFALDQQQALAPAPAPQRRIKHGRRTQHAADRQQSLFNQQQQQYEEPTARAYPQQQPQRQHYQEPQQHYQQQQQYQQQNYQQQPQYQQQQYQQPQTQPQYYNPQTQHQGAPFNPASLFQGHPARNIDLNTGSYSINYSG